MASQGDTLTFTIKVTDKGSKVIGAFEKKVTKLCKNVKTCFSNFGAFQKKVVSLCSAISKCLGNVINVLGKLKSLIGGINLVFGGLGSIFGVFTKVAGGALSLFKNAVNGVIKAVKFFASALSTAFQKSGEFLLEFGSDAVRSFMKFEDALTVARRTMGIVDPGKFDALGNSMRSLALDMSETGLQAGYSAIKLAEIAGAAGQVGLAAEDAAEFSRVIAMIAVATDVSAQKAASDIPIILNAFKLGIEKVENFGSALNALGNSLPATQSQILEITKKISAVASIFGLTAQQTLGLAATLKAAGVTVGVAGSSMSQILARIMQDYKKYAEVLKINSASLKTALESNNPSRALLMVLDALNRVKNVKGKIEMMETLKQLGIEGIRTQNSMLSLAANVNNLRQNMAMSRREFSKASSLQNEYNTSLDRASVSFGKVDNFVKEIHYIIGGPLADALSKFVEKHVLPLLQRFIAWLKTSKVVKKMLEVYLPAALEYLGGILDWATDKVMSFLESLGNEDKSSTFYKFCKEWIPAALNFLGEVLGYVGIQAADFFDALDNRERMTFIQKAFEYIGKSIKNAWEWLIDGRADEWLDKKFLPLLENVKLAWKYIKEKIKEAWKWLTDGSADVWLNNVLLPALDNVWKSMTIGFRLMQTISNYLSSAWVKGWSLAHDAIRNPAKEIPQYFSEASRIIGKFIDDVTTEMPHMTDALLSTMGDFFEELPHMARNAFDAMKKIWAKWGDELTALIEGLGGVWRRVFEGMSSYISDKVVGSISELTGGIQGLIDWLLETEDTSHNNSVWPDMLKWITKNIDGVQALTDNVGGLNSQLKSMDLVNIDVIRKQIGEMRKITTSAFYAPPANMVNVEENRLRDQLRNALQHNEDVRQARQAQKQPAQHAGSSGVVINNSVTFAGENIIDEYTYDRFARKIGETLQTQAERITVG